MENLPEKPIDARMLESVLLVACEGNQPCKAMMDDPVFRPEAARPTDCARRREQATRSDRERTIPKGQTDVI